MGLRTDILRIIKELGYRVNWGVKNSFIENYKGTGLQSEMGAKTAVLRIIKELGYRVNWEGGLKQLY